MRFQIWFEVFEVSVRIDVATFSVRMGSWNLIPAQYTAKNDPIDSNKNIQEHAYIVTSGQPIWRTCVKLIRIAIEIASTMITNSPWPRERSGIHTFFALNLGGSSHWMTGCPVSEVSLGRIS